MEATVTISLKEYQELLTVQKMLEENAVLVRDTPTFGTYSLSHSKILNSDEAVKAITVKNEELYKENAELKKRINSGIFSQIQNFSDENHPATFLPADVRLRA